MASTSAGPVTSRAWTGSRATMTTRRAMDAALRRGAMAAKTRCGQMLPRGLGDAAGDEERRQPRPIRRRDVLDRKAGHVPRDAQHPRRPPNRRRGGALEREANVLAAGPP